MSNITVRIDSSRPIFIEADADSFGQIFAGLDDHEQVNVLRSMVEHMKPHKIQWDYIAIALEQDENRDVRDELSVLFPAIRELLEQNERLKAALTKLEAAASGFYDSATTYFSDTTFDADGVLSNAHAELSVVALPDARAVIKELSDAP